MANVKITDLTAYTDAASTDVLAIVDVSNNVTKKISISDLLRATPLGTAALPAIAIDGDPNTGIYSPGADQLAFSTGGTGRLFIDSSGRVGIGASSPSALLHVNQTGVTGGEYGVRVSQLSATSSALRLTIDSTNTLSGLIQESTVPLVFGTNNTERLRIDSSGRLLVGTSTALTGNNTTYARIQVVGNSAASPAGGLIAIGRNEAATSITAGETLGTLVWGDSGAGEYAWVTCEADGTAGSSDYPGRLVFSTTADGASSPTERMRIDSSGRLLVGTSSSASAGGVTAQHAFSHSTSSQWAAQVEHTTAAGNAPFGLAIKYTAATPNGTSSDFLFCEDATAVRARIYSNGGLGNYSANNVNLSDRNAKKDIAPAAGTWDCLKEWEIVHFRYKDQPEDTDLSMGVIAQQVAESCPEVITVFQEAKEATETDPAQEERIGVKEQQMMWMAIKALQEAQLRIETLEAKVAALEGA